MKFLKYSALFLALLASATLSSCEDDTAENMTGAVDVEFENVVGSSPLVLNGPTYTTPAGDPFTVSIFRYYISNIKLTKADGTEYAQPESYYLIDQEKATSQKFTISDVPAGDYTGLTFTIGVDAARNVAGAQTGDLAKSDMFWSWNSGYIYTKLEGLSPQAPNRAVVFHIGGFMEPNNTIRTVSPAMNSNVMQVRAARTPEVHLKADVLKMFSGPNTIRFASMSNVMGGPNAVLVANNQAAGMFTVDHVHGN